MNRFHLLPRDWNRRVYTLEDFDNFCDRDGIQVFEISMNPLGLYTVCHQIPVILLNKNLEGVKKLYVEFHELAHHWLHSPGQQFDWGIESLWDWEANLVAACALIPHPILELKTDAQIQWEFGYSPKLIKFRREMYETWRI